MSIHFLSKGPIDQISGGYLYNRYLVEHLRSAGLDVTYHASIGDLDAIADQEVVIIDGLVLPDLAPRLLEVGGRLVLLLHVVPEPQAVEGREVLAVDALYRRSRVVVTGDSTLTSLRDELALAGVDAVKIEPGVPGHWHAKTRYSDRAHKLLGVANYLPGKGIARLIEALATLTDLDWHLTVRGNTDFDQAHYRAMRQMVAARGLADRIELLGPVPHDAVHAEMLGADLLILLSQHESYSMVTAEAIACGLPVLSCPTGNAESFGRSGLVRHVDHRSAGEVLRALISDSGEYGRLRRTGLLEARTWQDVGEEFLDWLGT
ncbi:MAG: glycosyltransferase family 4 protein [Longimicrobiales bacterium]